MNATCPECRSVFRVDPAKIPPAGVRARCCVCGAVWFVAAEDDRANAASVVAAEAAAVTSVAPAPVDERYAAEPATVGRPEPDTAPVGAVPPSPEPTQADDAHGDAGVAHEARPVAEPGQPVEERTADALPPRPVNPFLNNSPEQRARRLARALVSDLVAYNPQKREQGLRDGTLRQLFREEIRKSWDEYVEQVGATVAESTPHFQDALNDVLAGGRKVF